MNLVPALGQFQTKFSGHNAAAAVGRVTSDPNLHSAKVRLFFELCSSVFDGRKQ
jgi:hypothetical protein